MAFDFTWLNWALDPQRNSALAPLPHPKNSFLRKRVSQLPREHGDLPSVMRIVRDQVSDESRHIRTKALDPAISFERLSA